jgi:methyl coenzyme M reductase alpha subunit
MWRSQTAQCKGSTSELQLIEQAASVVAAAAAAAAAAAGVAPSGLSGWIMLWDLFVVM